MSVNPTDAARRAVKRSGVEALVVDDLLVRDLPMMGWSGSPSHLRSVAQLLAVVESGTGDVEYLALRAPGGEPIAKVCIDYRSHDDAGTLTQAAVHGDLQGLGLGTRLIAVAEERVRARGKGRSVMGVEESNPRARALYERLGYSEFSREHASWEHEDSDGRVSKYETEIVLLGKHLRGLMGRADG